MEANPQKSDSYTTHLLKKHLKYLMKIIRKDEAHFFHAWRSVNKPKQMV